MKKQLIGTTALVGVGTLATAGMAGDAQAADPLSLSIGGYFQTVLEYRDEDDDTGEPGANLQEFDIHNDGEIQFTAATTLDNGIGVTARIEFEAHNQSSGATNHDERWVQFSGGFGQLRIGSDDNASNAMHYQAPVAVGILGVNTPSWALTLAGGNAVGTTPSTYANTGGDAEKIIWFSPRIAGFQLGLSYAPDSTIDDQAQGVYLPSPDNTAGAQEDVISIGLNFVESFNDIDLAVSAGYLTGQTEATTANTLLSSDDIEQFTAGLNVGFAGFTVGASVRLSNNGLDNADSTTFDAGVTYSTGPLTVGFTYLHAEAENPFTGADDETDQGVIQASYNLGPGVDVIGGVKFFTYDGSGTPSSANENEGWILNIGTQVSF